MFNAILMFRKNYIEDNFNNYRKKTINDFINFIEEYIKSYINGYHKILKKFTSEEMIELYYKILELKQKLYDNNINITQDFFNKMETYTKISKTKYDMIMSKNYIPETNYINFSSNSKKQTIIDISNFTPQITNQKINNELENEDVYDYILNIDCVDDNVFEESASILKNLALFLKPNIFYNKDYKITQQLIDVVNFVNKYISYYTKGYHKLFKFFIKNETIHLRDALVPILPYIEKKCTYEDSKFNNIKMYLDVAQKKLKYVISKGFLPEAKENYIILKRNVTQDVINIKNFVPKEK